MKRFKPIAAAAMAATILSTAVYAGPNNHHHPRIVRTIHHDAHGDWVVPLVVGGVLGYVLAEPRRESVTYIQTAPAVNYAPLYEERWVYFGDCDCQRRVLVKVR